MSLRFHPLLPLAALGALVSLALALRPLHLRPVEEEEEEEPAPKRASAKEAPEEAAPPEPAPTPVASSGEHPNILFLISDDLRPSFGVYGGPIHAPNLDLLASVGTTFLRAYAQVALCSPSRSSLMTGRWPDETQVFNNRVSFRDALPDVVTLPEFFKQQGYHTVGLGKVYHGGFDDPASWSEPHWEPDISPGGRKGGGEDEDGEGGKDGPPYLMTQGPDNALFDGALADRAIVDLRRLAADREETGVPFFLAVGFKKPHLPFEAPQKYWDQYPLSEIQLADNPNPPRDVPPVALYDWRDLRAYDGVPKEGPVSDDLARTLIRGYYASASYMDAQLGRVVQQLDDLNLRQDTIIVAWGDHGWSLGEHGLWCKHTNFEDATRAPLILVVPGQKAPGQKTSALAEFVDVYPTLVAAAGFPLPEGLRGKSLLPLTDDAAATHKVAAFSQYRRQGHMGYSIRTERYRYTSWGAMGQELYDHKSDPGENINLANDPAHAEIVGMLLEQLKEANPGVAAMLKKPAREMKPTKVKGRKESGKKKKDATQQ